MKQASKRLWSFTWMVDGFVASVSCLASTREEAIGLVRHRLPRGVEITPRVRAITPKSPVSL